MKISKKSVKKVPLSTNGELSIYFIGSGSAFAKTLKQNNILVAKGDRNILIDCGGTCSQSLFDVGVALKDIDTYLITHSHADHVGGLEEAHLLGRYVLKTKPKIKRTMWSRRAQEYDQKINSGKIYELAEVVKDLNKNTDIIAEQSYSERQLFEKAYERLKSEFEAVLQVSPEEVQKKMDKALGRVKISEDA